LAVYNLSRVNILLVEDNVFVRNTIEDLLRQFQFGQVSIASSGEDAIEYLKTMNMAAQFGPDIIISDLVMSPINGMLLLRWVRSAKDSPNKMAPFIMLSGAADEAYVSSSRDLGVTEFLAKPFSAESVYGRILEIIDYPRQFVTTQRYFGPDRRRNRDGESPDGKEKREKQDKDVTIVYSSDKVVKPKGPSDVWYWRLPNSLHEKVSSGLEGAKVKGEIPTALLEEAESSLERAALDFTKWALEYLSNLSDLCTEALMEPGRRSIHFGKINSLALELRGQGGTFGYPLISTFGKMLFDATMEGCKEDDNAVEIVKAHIDAMRAVIREKISGDGGQVGRELLKGLEMSIERHKTVR